MSDNQKLQNFANPAGSANKPLPETVYYRSPLPQSSNVLNKLNLKPEPWPDPASIEEFKRYILLMLGHPVIHVELTDEMLKLAIDQAKAFLLPYLGKELYAYTVANTKQAEYDYPDDALFIKDVYYKPAYLGSLGNVNSALFSDFYLLATDLAVDIYESPTTFWAYMASREMLEKTYGVWGSWEKIDSRRFRIAPTPIRQHIVGVRYKSNQFDLTDDKYNLFRDLALAIAKEMLGRIRSKFNSIPGSNNNQLQLDGQALLSEAREDKQKIIDKAIAMSPLDITVF